MRSVTVVEYDTRWPRVFESLRAVLLSALGDTALAIEHVGSTSVPGLRAKPVIDIDVVVEGPYGVRTAIHQLRNIGYQHRGDLGIEGREAFKNPDDSPRHNLYVCPRGNLALRNHIAIRDALRADSVLATEYADLKLELAERFSYDMDGYIDGKTEFLLRILVHCGFLPAEVDSIRQANRPLP